MNANAHSSSTRRQVIRTGPATLIAIFVALQPTVSEGQRYPNHHPSLFYGLTDVNNLRNPPDCGPPIGPLCALKNLLQNGAGGNPSDPEQVCYVPDRGRGLSASALTCMITNDANICTAAKSWLLRLVRLAIPPAGPGWLCQTCTNVCRPGNCTDPCCNCEPASNPDFNQSYQTIGVAIAYDV